MRILASINRAVQTLSGWFSVLAALSLGYSWLIAKAPQFAALNWAEVALLAIAFGLISLLILSLVMAVAAYAFRLYKPLPADAAPQLPILDRTLEHHVAEIELERPELKPLEDRIEAFERRTSETVLNAYGPLKEKIEKTDQHVDRSFEQLRLELGKLEAKLVTNLAMDMEKVRREIGADRDEYRQAFLAVAYREKLAELANEIESGRDSLAEPIQAGRTLSETEWREWQDRERAWRKSLSDWLSIAHFYVPNARTKVETLTKDDERIIDDGKWTFREDQFPASDGGGHLRSTAVRRYKTYRVAATKWEDVRDTVDNVVYKVAFEGHRPEHWDEDKQNAQA